MILGAGLHKIVINSCMPCSIRLDKWLSLKNCLSTLVWHGPMYKSNKREMKEKGRVFRTSFQMAMISWGDVYLTVSIFMIESSDLGVSAVYPLANLDLENVARLHNRPTSCCCASSILPLVAAALEIFCCCCRWMAEALWPWKHRRRRRDGNSRRDRMSLLMGISTFASFTKREHPPVEKRLHTKQQEKIKTLKSLVRKTKPQIWERRADRRHARSANLGKQSHSQSSNEQSLQQQKSRRNNS